MITSLVLEWYDCSCHCGDDMSWSRLTVYRNKNHIIYEEFDGRDNLLQKQEGDYPKPYGDRFFWILEESNAEMTKKQDYAVDVCDGSCWKLKIRHSNNRLQKMNGTVEYPPHGKRLEHELIHLCEEACIFEPCLFGCCSIGYAAVQEFADKWLSIFTKVPRKANFYFDTEMGDDCFAVGFVMDCGSSFDRAYSKGHPLNTPEELAKVINEVDDVELLGSAIFSKWRAITHWSYEDGFEADNKAWFLMALKKLKELIETRR